MLVQGAALPGYDVPFRCCGAESGVRGVQRFTRGCQYTVRFPSKQSASREQMPECTEIQSWHVLTGSPTRVRTGTKNLFAIVA